MRVIGLPGRNPETEAWMQSLTASLQLGQTATEVAHYRHWDAGGDPDVAHEAGLIRFRSDDLVIGKSMGTMVLLAGAGLSGLPRRAVFIGTPISAYPAESIEALQRFAAAVPSLFIQQSADFTGSYASLEAVVGELSAVSLAEIAGEDHVYAETAELKTIIESWWQSLG